MYIYIRCFISNRRRRGLLRRLYTSKTLLLRSSVQMLSSGTTLVLDSSTRHILFIPTVTCLAGSGSTYETVYALTKHAQLELT